MTQENLNKQIQITIILLIAVICLFQFTNIDMYVQSFFYDFQTKSWLINKEEPILRLFLYDGFKRTFITLSVLLLFVLIFFRKNEIIQKHKKGLLIVLLSVIFVPLIVVSIKAITNMPCPCNVVDFGGVYPDIKVFEFYPENFIQTSRIRCWPAGHASIGFSLMSLFFIFKKRRNRQLALIVTIILGWVTGSYKMLLGDHFLSHTIITMILAWLIILIIVKFISFKEQRQNLEKSTKI